MVSIFIFGVLFLTACKKKVSVYNLEITESENNIWRIYDREGNNRGTLEVSPNDRINWEAVNSDVDFRFRTDIRTYFEIEEGMFENNRTQTIPEGGELNLVVRSDAPYDTLVYDIYVVSADTLVVGNSPPVMIIKSRK